jgi:hypothetical protein
MQREVLTPHFDVAMDCHGPVWTLKPLSDLGRDWLASNLPDEGQWRDAFVVRATQIQALIWMMIDDGIAVH